jgi:hypothetical protein
MFPLPARQMQFRSTQASAQLRKTRGIGIRRLVPGPFARSARQSTNPYASMRSSVIRSRSEWPGSACPVKGLKSPPSNTSSQ